jgi:hypothetical protein
MCREIHAWSTYGILHHGTSPEMLDAFGPVRYGGNAMEDLSVQALPGNFSGASMYLLTPLAIPNLANAKGKYEHTENSGPQSEGVLFMMSFRQPSCTIYLLQ